jgi:hypothetical protein
VNCRGECTTMWTISRDSNECDGTYTGLLESFVYKTCPGQPIVTLAAPVAVAPATFPVAAPIAAGSNCSTCCRSRPANKNVLFHQSFPIFALPTNRRTDRPGVVPTTRRKHNTANKNKTSKIMISRRPMSPLSTNEGFPWSSTGPPARTMAENDHGARAPLLSRAADSGSRPSQLVFHCCHWCYP